MEPLEVPLPDEEESAPAAAQDDRISDLPGDLMSAILGQLPAKEAVRTSVLASGWRPLWASVPRLDFCPPPAEAAASNQPDAVDRVLGCHDGALSSCRLLLDPPAECLARLAGWVAALAEKRVRSLELHGLTDAKKRRSIHVSRQYLPAGPALPRGAFAGAAPSLRHLSLCGFTLPHNAYLVGCGANLTSLHLSYISLMTDGSLSNILAVCPRLQGLSLSACAGLARVVISSPALRHLALSRLPCLHSVSVDAPSLATLAVSGVTWSDNFIDLRVPRLVALITVLPEAEEKHGGWVDGLCCRCTRGVLAHLNRRRLDAKVSPFWSLCRLAVHLNLDDLRQVAILRFTLMACHVLQEVKIENGKWTTPNEDQEEEEEQQHKSLPCSRMEGPWGRYSDQHLKDFCSTVRKVSLSGYRGDDPECDFLAFLVLNAAGMRKLEVWCCSRCPRARLKATRERLSTVERASADLVVTFHGKGGTETRLVLKGKSAESPTTAD